MVFNINGDWILLHQSASLQNAVKTVILESIYSKLNLQAFSFMVIICILNIRSVMGSFCFALQKQRKKRSWSDHLLFG